MAGGFHFAAASLLAWLLLTASAASQARTDDPEIEPKGWKVPDLRQLSVKRQASELWEGRSIKRLDFDVKNRKPNIQISEDLFCEFTTLSSFVFKKRTFAISGECQFFGIDTLDLSGKYAATSKTYAAALTHYTFYDKDGDGKFEARYNSAFPRPGVR